MARLERAAALSPDPRDRAARLIGAAELGYELTITQGIGGAAASASSNAVAPALPPSEPAR